MKAARLREATAADHDAVENAVPLMKPNLSLPEYAAILRRLHGVVAAWEGAAERAAPPDLLPMVQARQRRGLLEDDLRRLGTSGSEEQPEMAGLAVEAELLGAMYVMEGSRLGGQFIARHIEEVFGFPPGDGTAYFRGFGEQTGSMWKELLAMIEARVPEEDEERTIQAARAMFSLFGAWMRDDGSGYDVS